MVKRIALAAVLVVLLAPIQARALDTSDLLAVVAMPLAVAAVSEVTDVPISELIDVVTLMNQADVPPAQFVEVVRYVPIALVADTDAQFVEFVRLRTVEGIRGDALVTSIEQQIRTYGVPEVELTVTAPRLDVFEATTIVPAIVQTRLADVRAHPHGGPPGQVKKQIGVQTGAEVVHGQRRNRVRVDDDRDRTVARRVVVSDDRGPKPGKVKVQHENKGHGNKGHGNKDHGNKDHGNKDHGNKGQGKGKGPK